MTVELDIVERRNEENLKLSKQMEDTMKKLIMDTNEPIAAPINDVNFDTANGNCIATAPTELQRFYAGKNVFITGGTGTHTHNILIIVQLPCVEQINSYYSIAA